MSMNYFGGNSGYIGYSESVRSRDAKREGRFPKTLFKREYGVSEKMFNILLQRKIISGGEWHHTSKFGNRTTFYSIDDEILFAYLTKGREAAFKLYHEEKEKDYIVWPPENPHNCRTRWEWEKIIRDREDEKVKEFIEKKKSEGHKFILGEVYNFFGLEWEVMMTKSRLGIKLQCKDAGRGFKIDKVDVSDRIKVRMPDVDAIEKAWECVISGTNKTQINHLVFLSPYIEREAIAEKVFAEHGDTMRMLIKGHKVLLERIISQSGKSRHYEGFTTRDVFNDVIISDYMVSKCDRPVEYKVSFHESCNVYIITRFINSKGKMRTVYHSVNRAFVEIV